MRQYRSLAVLSCAVALVACGDSSGPDRVATSIEIVTGAPATAPAGVALATSPAFVVRDQNGEVMEGVPVTISVSAGGGTLANPPSASASGPTSVGQWTLGGTVGVNTLTISVAGLAPVTLTVSSQAGAVAKIVALTPTEATGTVGQAVSPLPSVRVTDAFDNPIAATVLTVVVAGGGSASATTLTTDAAGTAAIPDWTLGTVKGANTITLRSGNIATVFTVNAAAGPLHALTVSSGDGQVALAGTPLPQPVRLSPVDQYGNTLDNQTATIGIAAGGGFASSGSATSGPGGLITLPTWTLGKSAVPQQLLATVGTRTVAINATVRSAYVIDVRFWGEPMTPEHRALFATAAARIRGAVVGELPIADATGADPAACGVTGVPSLSEQVPGVIIYASIQNIDGKGRILARAGPCYIRSDTDFRTVIGVMEFDIADIGSLEAGGNLLDVIVHEMLHVVGVGSFWQEKGLLQNAGTSTVAYTGVSGVQGCRETGGTTTCANTVPVENTGGAGTAGSHWRESVFATELMTGFLNAGSNPFSAMTVRSIEDLGYSINAASADAYFIAIGSLRLSDETSPLTAPGVEWERGLPRRPTPLPRSGSGAATTR